MQYRNFNKTGEKVSLLGMGTMRLPLNHDGSIDEEQAIAMIRHSIDSGVNYVDTAWMYHDGQSEVVTGKALKDGYREKVFLADKMPAWLAKDEAQMKEMFFTQLERCDTDYFDMYLVHNITKPVW
ncbi:MAG: aldo/keto reductase, partial [Anaerovoracaceae bacterium]